MSEVSWKRIALLVGLCVGSVIVRLPFLSVPLTDDEGAYAYWASIWTGDHQLYRDFIFARPQGILVAYKLLLATIGDTVEAIRLFAALFNCLTIVALFFFARSFFSEREALVSAALYAVVSTAPRIEGFTANAEIFTLAPLVVCAYLTWKKKWFWAGVATAIAFLLKPSGVEGCALIAIWILVNWRSWRGTLSATSSALLGFSIGLLPSVLHGVWIGWDAYWYNMYTIRTMVYVPTVVSFDGQISRIVPAVLTTIPSWIIPTVLFAVALKHMGSAKRRFCIAWLGAAIFGMQVGFWWNWHFFQQIVPPLCFASGMGLLALRTTSLRLAWATALVCAVTLFWIRDGRLWLLEPYEISWAIFHRTEYLFSTQIADYVAATTSPDDTLYIAFGQAEIYFLSGRRPTVPTQMFYSHARYFDSEWPKAIEAIKNREPAMIVWAQFPPPNRITPYEFERLIREGYDLDRKFGPIPVYRRKADTGG